MACHDLDDMSMLIHIQCYSMCSQYPPSARRHALSRALNLSVDASMTRFQCSAKRLTDAVAFYRTGVTSNDVSGTQKRQLS